mmetsp:Transcript_37196/g.104972  ORF Transcript_37196/g.104972 Transcript_37196/m.104972 type:complete len:472 (-) Transcript_37196:170-1585(-)
MGGEGKLVNTLQALDQFRIVSSGLAQGSSNGAFQAIGYASLILLLIAELGTFLKTSYSSSVIVDSNDDSLMPINFDITLHDLPCKYLKIGVWDKFGEEKITGTEMLKYTPVDHVGMQKGRSYSKEELGALEQMDTAQLELTAAEIKEIDSDWSSSHDDFKHKDFHAAVTFHDFTLVNFFAEWCGHCRQFSPMWKDAAERVSEKMMFSNADGRETTVKFMKVNCVDFGQACQDAKIKAFPSVRLYKRDGSFEVYQQKRTVPNIISFLQTTIKKSHLMIAHHHLMFSEGCRVSGSLAVPRVPGHFHLQAEAFGNVNINPAITNVSHIVHHLSFGEKDVAKWAKKQSIPKEMITHITPLDGKEFCVYAFHEAPQHYLKVVSTHVQGKPGVFYQMTHTDRVRVLRNALKSAAPQARFTYDFSPMSVVVKVKSKRWYEFLTSLMAILGGTYTVLEILSGAVGTVAHSMKEAMGKAG